MEFRQLEYAISVADRGGFTAGARAAHVAQPSVSQAVRALEVELGVELFHRVGRGVVLTDAGEVFVGAARQVLRDLAVLRAAVAAVGALVTGRLDLVALPTLAVDPVAPLVGAFRRAHPGVAVRMLEPAAGGVAGAVRSGRAELGVVDLPVGGDDLVVEPLGIQELFAVGDEALAGLAGLRGDASARRPHDVPPVPLVALADTPVVATAEGTSTRRVVDEAFAEQGLEPNVSVEVDQRDAIVALVLSGAGVGFLPAGQAQAARRQGATVCRLTPAPTRTIGIVRRDRPLSPAAGAFLEVARAEAQPKRPVM